VFYFSNASNNRMSAVAARHWARHIVVLSAVLALSLFLSCGTASEEEGAAREVKQYTIDQFMRTVTIGGASFSADESRILFSSDQTGILNAYTIPVTGGTAAALTSSDKESIYATSYFPEDDRILYSSDKGGNEITHLFVRKLDGTEEEITPGEKVKAGFGGWAHDQKSFFIVTNERDPRYMDFYKVSVEDYSKKLFYQNDKGYFPADISRDERYIVLTKVNSSNDTDIILHDLKSGGEKNITAHEGIVRNGPLSIDPDSKYLYFSTDEGSEFGYVRRYEFASGLTEDVLRKDWDINGYSFSHNGKYRTVVTNEDAETKIQIFDSNGVEVELPSIPRGDITGLVFTRSEEKMAFYVNGDTSPSNLFVYDLNSKEVKQLTKSLNPEIDPADLVDSEIVRFPSFDGMEIPGPLWIPHGAGRSNRKPALVWVHGGPGGQTRKGYMATVQYLVNHGYVVYGVNNRGSSGYGKSFLAADDQKHGKEPLQDCVEAKKYLAALDFVDPDKIGIIGGSYGGYMTLAALAFEPEAFDVGVDIFGVSNWLRTLKSIPAWWEAQRTALYQELGNPETQEELLHEISPLFHAENITKPLLVLQGANDPRVLQAESDEIVEAIKKKNGVVEYIVFDDEGHGFSKKKNQIQAYEAIRKFLDTHLKGSQ